MSTEKEDMVSNWIKENGNPAIEKLTQINLETAGKVAEMLDEKGLNAGNLAQLMDTHVAEVNKWLNGKHNFSEQTLAKITSSLASNN
ncbi:helix-turn-helix transcriptional regulator [Pedobacter sp. Leaf194]|uniref:helix-turn-helix domain-containing protein n=1 Tax=Pedobacter sp. Leaf194 TaxID=1736297 RepID=UPI000703AA1A|nr:helix-turn-helix transcriptional regulator [Pedobacter sp. Leaf194]KQS40949.1 hypothetical protein ASG14_00205 [Pedobacter sp. Leaf194]RYD79029.1 MAG: XRE family transcriptional regulator [Sphingobacteriales bacterium]